MIAQGRYPAFTCKIRPFYDRLDLEYDFLLYEVDPMAPAGPETVFTDRFYEHRERWIPPGVGTVPGSEKPYFGPLPPKNLRPVVGTDDQWLRGFSYEAFLRGEYATGGCCTCKEGPPVRIRQAQTIDAPWPYRPWAGQAQNVYYGLGAPLHQGQQLNAWTITGWSARGSQSQAVQAAGNVDRFPVVGQAEDINATGVIGLGAAARQAQRCEAVQTLAVAAPTKQAQRVLAIGSVDAFPVIGQAQRVEATGVIGLPALARQAQDTTATELIARASAARQAQHAALAGGILRNVAIGQAQRVTAIGGLDAFPLIGQAQRVEALGNVDAFPLIRQAQHAALAGGILRNVAIGQAQRVEALNLPVVDAPASQAQRVDYGSSVAANPGLVCAAYQAVVAGQLYAFGSSLTDPQWWGNSLPTAGNYLAWVYITTGTGFICNVYTGTCAALNLVDTFSVTGSTPVTIAPGDGIYFQVVASSAVVPYTIVFYQV